MKKKRKDKGEAPRLGFEIFQFQQSYLEIVSQMEAAFI